MVRLSKTTTNYILYSEQEDLYYTLVHEIDHDDYDEEYITIIDENNFEVENDELFEELTQIWEKHLLTLTAKEVYERTGENNA
jgi:hypothetical protein